MSWNLVKTPNPNEDALRVWVADGVALQLMGRYTAGVTTLKAFELGTGPESEGCADWVYTYKEDVRDEEGRRPFYFAKNKTEVEKYTPFKTRWLRHGPHPWPGIVENFELVADHAFPLSTNIVGYGRQGVATGPTYHPRYDYTHPASEGSRFLLKEYFAATEFNIKRFRVPMPTTVRVTANGLDLTIPEVLTDEIDLPATRTTTSRYIEGVGELGGSGNLPGRTIPRTNVKRWIPHVHSVPMQEQRDGGFYLPVIWVFPPLRGRRGPR